MYKQCTACEAAVINGVYCHEQGCPEAWRDEVRECGWCGAEFKPESRDQLFCEDSCGEAFNS